jgi:hypothetical protein
VKLLSAEALAGSALLLYVASKESHIYFLCLEEGEDTTGLK